MTSKVKQLEKEALKLSKKERAVLAEHLIVSLEEEEDFEQAWFGEAERRYQNYKAGKTKAMPAEIVFRNMERKLRNK